ncbi:hypothetical protein IAT38_003501 [Cryptococcus sp. DSM 104549]
MPAPPPIAYATLTSPLPSAPYILGIHPSPTTPHLILRHPAPSLTIADAQTLQSVGELQGGHKGHVSSVAVDDGELWSAGKDGTVVRWDERSRGPATVIKAFIRKPLPVLSLASAPRDSLIIGGTELLSSEAHILFWDPRSPSTPIYTHSSTHSDDITHLSILPPSTTFLPRSATGKNPERLLLSASTDGLVALSDMKEADEEEAVVSEENWGQSVAGAGGWMHKGGMKIWARSDMDEVVTFGVGRGAEGEIELQNQKDYPSTEYKFKTFKLPQSGPSITQTALDELKAKDQLKSDYVVDVVPSLGTSKDGGPMVAVGTNDGDMILQHSTSSGYRPSAFFLTGPHPSRGPHDVIRALYHDLSNEALYTGSEDGVLSGFSLASLPERLTVGDPDVDDDGGDGREVDEDMDEESEIETEESEEESDEDEDMEVEDGPRYGEIIGAGKGRSAADERKEKRKKQRLHPY